MGAILTSGAAIDGVFVHPLTPMRDERGAVMHMLREDSPWFERFGEIYFSVVKKGAVKAWKRHLQMAQNFTAPSGEIRLVIYDDRESSPTRGNLLEVITGQDRYGLVKIPPLLWYGFTGLSEGESLIANCATLPHDPAESERLEPASSLIPFTW